MSVRIRPRTQQALGSCKKNPWVSLPTAWKTAPGLRQAAAPAVSLQAEGVGWGRGTESQPQRGGGKGGEKQISPPASDQCPIGRELRPLSASGGSLEVREAGA